jgi:hypothetical protein
MALVVAGVAASRSHAEHGKKAITAALHPNGRSLFIVAGQVVDEIDTRDGSLISRIFSDVPGACQTCSTSARRLPALASKLLPSVCAVPLDF